MRIFRRLAMTCLALAALALAAESIAPRIGLSGSGVFPSAEARVGRPLTPVSVAGVARRTVRRCAVGVYDC